MAKSSSFYWGNYDQEVNESAGRIEGLLRAQQFFYRQRFQDCGGKRPISSRSQEGHLWSGSVRRIKGPPGWPDQYCDEECCRIRLGSEVGEEEEVGV
jgi:hypothetical protein